MQDQLDCRLWKRLGSHPLTLDGQDGYQFRVWAPNARQVCLMGDFNNWDAGSLPMDRAQDGVWELFVPGRKVFDAYKYAIHTNDGRVLAKADPYAFHAETRPAPPPSAMT